MSDLLALLDQLDEARANSTPGEWYVPTDRPIRMFSDTTSRPGIGMTYMPADAALIVAAVNAAPKLTAALRAVLDVADEVEADGEAVAREEAEMPNELDLQGIADRIRAAITAALTPEATP